MHSWFEWNLVYCHLWLVDLCGHDDFLRFQWNFIKFAHHLFHPFLNALTWHLKSTWLDRSKFCFGEPVLDLDWLSSHSLLCDLTVLFFDVLTCPNAILHFKSRDVRLASHNLQALGLVYKFSDLWSLGIKMPSLCIVNLRGLPRNLVLKVVNVPNQRLIFRAFWVFQLSQLDLHLLQFLLKIHRLRLQSCLPQGRLKSLDYFCWVFASFTLDLLCLW